ncbi:MAG: M13 family peptidase [Calditrichaeota bacterium]|nr:MAG: M13 family peptidase [Calditrichota bacterium]
MKGYVLLALLLILAACQTAPKKSGIDYSRMDKTVRPQDDYYHYMNGTWLREFEIPADKSNYGTFTKLYDEAQQHLKDIIEEAAHAQNAQPGSEQQKVGDLYKSFMDSARIEALGLKPIQKDLKQIAAMKNHQDVVDMMAAFSKASISKPFGIWVDQDAKNTTQYIAYINQGGLSLPDRDYYLSDNERFKSIRQAYMKHLEKMFTMAGMAHPADLAQSVFDLEKKIAQKHWTRVAQRDRNKTYNKFTRDALKKSAPQFDWDRFFTQSEMDKIDQLIVRQPDYIQAFGKLFKQTPVSVWKAYLSYKLLSDAAPYLSSDFVNENFDFYAKTLAGVPQIRPRWKRGVSLTEGVLGEAIGKIYVSRFFKPEAKERMKQLVANLKEAFHDRLEQLDWMSPATKEKAKAKLAKFGTKIGYPDKWKDYSALEITADDLIGNLRRAALFEHKRQMDKLGKPIDREEWHMYPQTVNAYYNPSMNEIVFPAAILQPPFFNMEADDAVNYGGIGAVIGHELTHGFDDQGRKSDGDGNLTDWWTEEDAKEFEKRAQRMVEEYNKFSPIEGMHVNGAFTLGENIADLGGLTIAWYAYHKSLKGKEAPVIDGLSGDERFFLGWAQVWGRKYREDELRRRLKTDPHSPSEYRVNGIVTNMPEFYSTYQVKEGDGLFTPDSLRVRIW